MNILILNWRDPANPLAGGAEKITYKYAAYWASRGHNVFWICNSFPESKSEERTGDVHFYRIPPDLTGGVSSLFFKYSLYLAKTIIKATQIITNQRIDIVIDEIHGMPFFSPFYFSGRKVLLVCEVADHIWEKMFPFPISFVGAGIERFIYSLYSSSEIWAISKSTRQDIFTLKPDLNVHVLPLGIDPVTVSRNAKTNFPSAIFLARLVKMKGAETAIYAAKNIVDRYPGFKLYMVGMGTPEYTANLKSLASSLDIEDNVMFMGRVGENAKYDLLSKVHFLFHPSYKEGFGLTILEAGTVATPTIARKGSSMDELITNGRNGLLFDQDDEISSLFIKYYNSAAYQTMVQLATSLSRKYMWPKILQSSTKLTQL